MTGVEVIVLFIGLVFIAVIFGYKLGENVGF